MFDRFVVVDWSANSTPKLGARLDLDRECTIEAGQVSVTNLATRA